jgi:hypothetical protein
MHNLGTITPESLASIMNFKLGNLSWRYSSEDPAMEARQAEGAAGLWNILNTSNVAMLADEVGMGKTIQALAVCATLWHHKPDARVLVFTPRQAVLSNWVTEYTNFVAHHYQRRDGIMKSPIDNTPIKQVHELPNLYELARAVKNQAGSFYLAKITSLSYLVPRIFAGRSPSRTELNRILRSDYNLPDISAETFNRENIVATLATHLRQILLDTCGKFDLVIVDEAHYLRNIGGNSNRVEAAKAFFGSGKSSLANSALLLTATPNHGGMEDIQNIVRYFDADLASEEPTKILEERTIRRLRRLCGLTKYNYREESAPGATFSDDISGELFYAMYQKKLVDMRFSKKKQESSADLSSGKLFYGYMEGFEFIPETKSRPRVTDSQEELDEQGPTTDFHQSEDTEILVKLATKYREIYGDSPAHPKYKALTNLLSPAEKDLWHGGVSKNLVFVRRIPSLYEITRRVLENYDQAMWAKMPASRKLSDERDIPDREQFTRRFKHLAKSVDELDAEAVETGESEESPEINVLHFEPSKVLSLFATQKAKKNEKAAINTEAALFRHSFTRPNSIFSLFFQHGSSYDATPLGINSLTRSGPKKKTNYYVSGGRARLSERSEPAAASILTQLFTANRESTPRIEVLEIETLWSIFWQLGGENNLPAKVAFDAFDLIEKEALSLYLLKGVLYASASCVELYGWFVETRERLKSRTEGVELYREFSQTVRQNLQTSRLFDLMRETILGFRVFYEKFSGVKSKNHLIRPATWSFFENAQPVYAYSGQSQPKSILPAFNSPFFPDVLVATSVLQEGVNLQNYCSQVIHYGLAWTPGDNEQRVGRIDRMFSQLERELNVDKNAFLNIQYPFIKQTLDEDQLTRFLALKRESDTHVDRCIQNQFEGSYLPEQLENLDVQKLLRHRDPDLEAADPYPATKYVQNLPSLQFKPDELVPFESIRTTIQKALKFDNFSTFAVSEPGQSIIAIADPKIESEKGTRHQPIIVELMLPPELVAVTHDAAYVLRFRSPIGTQLDSDYILAAYQSVSKTREIEFPLARLACDEDSDVSSCFYWQVVSDILLLPASARFSSLSDQELRTAFQSVRKFADLLEREAFEDQDLAMHDMDQDKEVGRVIAHRVPTNDFIQLGSRGSEFDSKSPWTILDDNKTVALQATILSRDWHGGMLSFFTANFRNPFVNFAQVKSRISLQLAYLRSDLQKAEMEILERWFFYKIKQF